MKKKSKHLKQARPRVLLSSQMKPIRGWACKQTWIFLNLFVCPVEVTEAGLNLWNNYHCNVFMKHIFEVSIVTWLYDTA